MFFVSFFMSRRVGATLQPDGHSVLIGLVTVALRLRDRFFPGETAELAGAKNCVGSFPAAPGRKANA